MIPDSTSVRRDRRRILYLSKHFGFPLGGVRIAYHHVAILNRNGFDARILLVDDSTVAHFSDDVATERLNASFALRATDLFVIPEPWDGLIRRLRQFKIRKYVFCQNHFYAFHGLVGARDYADAGVDTVFCCSEVIAEFLTGTMGLDRAPIIHNAIDHSLFKPGTKRRQVALMPRKMKIEATYLRGLLQRRHPDMADVPWIEISGKAESEVAQLLAESAVFLALGRLEGFGLPPIEAMASGCIVVGFTGDGGRSFATTENGLWCDAEDWNGCVDRLAQALRGLDGPEARCMVEAGIATAAQFTLARMEAELVSFWQAEIDR